MTLNDFIKKYNGRFVEYHSFSANSKNQCVDLANAYIVEVLGLPAIIGTNAQDFPTKRGKNFEWIVNTPEGLPQEGDLMIFKSADGVGHISIFVEGNLSLFRSFDQNYPTGSPCKIVQHNYRNVLGWLRKIMPENTYSEAQMTTVRLERDKNWNLYQAEKADHEATKSELKEVRSSFNRFLEKLGSMLVSLADEANIIGAVERLLTVEDQLTESRKNYDKLEKEKDDEIRKVTELYEKRIKSFEVELSMAKENINNLTKELEEIKAIQVPPQQEKPISPHFNGLSGLIKSIKSVLRRILWLK